MQPPPCSLTPHEAPSRSLPQYCRAEGEEPRVRKAAPAQSEAPTRSTRHLRPSLPADDPHSLTLSLFLSLNQSISLCKRSLRRRFSLSLCLSRPLSLSHPLTHCAGHCGESPHLSLSLSLSLFLSRSLAGDSGECTRLIFEGAQLPPHPSLGGSGAAGSCFGG